MACLYGGGRASAGRDAYVRGGAHALRCPGACVGLPNHTAEVLNGLSLSADFPKAVKRLLHNDILMCRTASSVLHILPIAGIYTFLPKYLESQFRMTAAAAAMISGTLVAPRFKSPS